MYVCMYACMYVCMYECMYVRMYVRMYVCMYACTLHVRTNTHDHVHMHELERCLRQMQRNAEHDRMCHMIKVEGSKSEGTGTCRRMYTC